MLAKRLISTIELEKTTWLKYRQKGISGSDLGAICGLNKWKSPMAVYLEKIGETPLEQEDNEFMLWGRVLEPVIAEEFKRRNPEYKVKRINAILQHPKYEWALGNVDREIIDDKGERGILEIKTVSEYGKDSWKDENIPDTYAVQLQWYLFVTGYKYGYFAALCGGNKYIQKRVERDDDIINDLKAIAEDFWNKVLIHQPPVIDASEATTNVLNALYPRAKENAPMLQLESKFDTLIRTRESFKENINQLQKEVDEIENKIKAIIQDSEAAETKEYMITWKNCKGKETFNTKAFKKDYPQIADKYLGHGKDYRTLKINKKEMDANGK